MNLRLGFHYHVPALYQDGAIYMPGYLMSLSGAESKPGGSSHVLEIPLVCFR